VWAYEVLQQCRNGATQVGIMQDGNVQDLILLRAINDIAPYDAPYGKGEERWKRVTEQCNNTSLDGGKTFPLGTAKASTLKGRLKKYMEAFVYIVDKIGDDDSDATVYDGDGPGSRKSVSQEIKDGIVSVVSDIEKAADKKEAEKGKAEAKKEVEHAAMETIKNAACGQLGGDASFKSPSGRGEGGGDYPDKFRWIWWFARQRHSKPC
jgi:hypothetical protein